jgi:hypothetical protein
VLLLILDHSGLYFDGSAANMLLRQQMILQQQMLLQQQAALQAQQVMSKAMKTQNQVGVRPPDTSESVVPPISPPPGLAGCPQLQSSTAASSETRRGLHPEVLAHGV